MNFIDGTIKTSDSGAVFQCEGFSFPVHPAVASVIPNGSSKEMTYGIRAEDVVVDTNPGERSVGVSVFGSEMMGSEQYVHGRNGGTTIVARAPMDFRAAIGAGVWMNLTSANAHLFDAENEQALV
jgi:ABC-type sugar transport system ATPase subunit